MQEAVISQAARKKATLDASVGGCSQCTENAAATARRRTCGKRYAKGEDRSKLIQDVQVTWAELRTGSRSTSVHSYVRWIDPWSAWKGEACVTAGKKRVSLPGWRA